jgi:hypothetical protein
VTVAARHESRPLSILPAGSRKRGEERGGMGGAPPPMRSPIMKVF